MPRIREMKDYYKFKAKLWELIHEAEYCLPKETMVELIKNEAGTLKTLPYNNLEEDDE